MTRQGAAGADLRERYRRFMVSGFISDRRPTSNRYAVRLHLGMRVRLESESAVSSSPTRSSRRDPAEADALLLALAGEFTANDRALRRRLEGDGRCVDDIPGLVSLADWQLALVEQIASTPSRGSAGPLAKALCARLHPIERGFDAAVALSPSLADDLLRIGDPSALSLSWACLLRPRFSTPGKKEQT